MAYLYINEIKIWYDIQGEGEPIVLVGGNSLLHRQWDFLAPILAKDFKVILVDQRGAGLSERTPNNLSVETWADDINQILYENGIQKAHLLGTSSGSMVVIKFAAKYPEKTGSLIHYGMYKMDEDAAKIYKVGFKIVEEFGDSHRGSYFLVRLFGIPSEYEEWEVEAFEQNISSDTWIPMHQALFIDLSDDLLKIQAPQLLLIGDSGPLSKDSGYGSGWKEIQKRCSNVDFAIIPGASGTYCVIEKPKVVANKVTEFLNNHMIN